MKLWFERKVFLKGLVSENVNARLTKARFEITAEALTVTVASQKDLERDAKRQWSAQTKSGVPKISQRKARHIKGRSFGFVPLSSTSFLAKCFILNAFREDILFRFLQPCLFHFARSRCNIPFIHSSRPVFSPCTCPRSSLCRYFYGNSSLVT